MVRTPAAIVALLFFTSITACDKSAGSVACGLDALTGPLAVKQSFAQGAVLTELPSVAPSGVPVRLVAGPAWHGAITSEAKGRWQITTRGTVAKEAHVGYGVLVVDGRNAVLGVFAFDGRSVVGATRLGSLAIGDTVVPLLGVRIDAAALQQTQCPFFPDSLR